MGYYCNASGTLTWAAKDGAAILAAGNAAATYNGPAATIVDLLTEGLGFEDVDLNSAENASEVSVEVTYSGKHWSGLDAALTALAGAGVSGSIEWTGEDDNRWVSILDRGQLRELSAETYYPGHPDEGAEIVALTRRQARAVLALVAGDQVADLQDTVRVLTEALNTR